MILVTGATGFLGAELVFQLVQNGNIVRCLKRENSVIPKKLIPLSDKIEWFIADILDYSDLDDAFENVSQVYHCAALVSFDERKKSEMLLVNAEGTANIVNLALDHQIDKLVHVSSIAALGNAKNQEPINEDSFWEGFETHDAYAVSKYRAEMEVWRGIHEGLNAVIVNPSLIIGADAGIEGSGALFNYIKNGLSYYTQGATGFVDVEDVAECMILLMEAQVEGQRFVINAENWTYQKLFTLASKKFGNTKQLKLAKPWLLKLVSKFVAVKNAFSANKIAINKTLLNAANKSSQYSNNKLTTLLNYQFKPVEKTITEIVNSLKKP